MSVDRKVVHGFHARHERSDRITPVKDISLHLPVKQYSMEVESDAHENDKAEYVRWLPVLEDARKRFGTCHDI